MVKEAEQYIKNQKEHHKKIGYADEVELFMKKYELEFVNPAFASRQALKRL